MRVQTMLNNGKPVTIDGGDVSNAVIVYNDKLLSDLSLDELNELRSVLTETVVSYNCDLDELAEKAQGGTANQFNRINANKNLAEQILRRADLELEDQYAFLMV